MSRGNSRTVASTQPGPHPQLATVVGKHLRHPFRRPASPHTQHAFEQLQDDIGQRPQKLIFDSGCGVGESTVHLAHQFPGHWVIGIDKSDHRLQRHPLALPSNARLLRADLVDFWRLAHRAGWQLDRHYLLYPNPWPKPHQLQLRWHGHAVFADMLALGGELELRSNWSTYVEEMHLALSYAGIASSWAELAPDGEDISPFERKYRCSGHQLWYCRATLESGHQPSILAQDMQRCDPQV